MDIGDSAVVQSMANWVPKLASIIGMGVRNLTIICHLSTVDGDWMT